MGAVQEWRAEGEPSAGTCGTAVWPRSPGRGPNATSALGRPSYQTLRNTAVSKAAVESVTVLSLRRCLSLLHL